MGHDRILTVKSTDGTMYGVDKWESTSTQPATTEWKHPARIKNLDEGRRLDRWETADRPNHAFSDMDDAIEIAIEGLERLLIDHHIDPDVITVTRHAPFSDKTLASKVDIDAEFVNSAEQSIRK